MIDRSQGISIVGKTNNERIGGNVARMNDNDRRTPPSRPRLKKESLRRLDAAEMHGVRGGMGSDVRTDVGEMSRYCQD